MSDHLPARPEPPHPDECCGRGCVPCIFDYYEMQLEKWYAIVEKIENEKDH